MFSESDTYQETSTIPTNGKYAISLDVETANKKFGIAQIIESKNCVGAIGDTITFSFKAKVSDTSKLDNVKAAIVSWSGTEDTVTSDIISAWGNEGTNPTLITNATYENTPANLSLTTSYATYSVSANIDTSGATNIIVFIWSDVTDTTAGHFLYVTDCQLERGNAVTPFEHRTFTDEKNNCLRYFYALREKGLSATYFAAGYYYSSSSLFGHIIFPVEMRATPTIETSGTDTFYWYGTGTGKQFDGFTLNGADKFGANLAATSEPSGTQGDSGGFYALGTSSFVYFKAEL